MAMSPTTLRSATELMAAMQAPPLELIVRSQE